MKTYYIRKSDLSIIESSPVDREKDQYVEIDLPGNDGESVAISKYKRYLSFKTAMDVAAESLK